jgi:hypothetical protein
MGTSWPLPSPKMSLSAARENTRKPKITGKYFDLDAADDMTAARFTLAAFSVNPRGQLQSKRLRAWLRRGKPQS